MILLKTSWICLEDVFETSWRHLEDVLKTLLQDVLKTIGKRLEKVFVRHLKDVLKMSSRCMAKTNILVLIKTSWRLLLKTYDLRRIYSSWSRRLRDVLKASFEGENKRDLNKVFKVFIKTNICWVRIFNEKKNSFNGIAWINKTCISIGKSIFRSNQCQMSLGLSFRNKA